MIGASAPLLSLPSTAWFGVRGRMTAGTDDRHVAEVGRLYPHPPRGLPCAIPLLAVSHQAAWEATAEAWVVRHEGGSYVRGASFGRPASGGDAHACLGSLLSPTVWSQGCVSRATRSGRAG